MNILMLQYIFEPINAKHILTSLPEVLDQLLFIRPSLLPHALNYDN